MYFHLYTKSFSLIQFSSLFSANFFFLIPDRGDVKTQNASASRDLLCRIKIFVKVTLIEKQKKNYFFSLFCHTRQINTNVNFLKREEKGGKG